MTTRPVPIGRPSLLRYTNAISLLQLLREAGSCSKADLVRASGLSAPTVTNVITYLQSANLIAAIGEGESSGGRPPDMIRFKAERGCIAAVEISARTLIFLLTDLNGKELATHVASLAKQGTTPEAICALIAEELNRMLRALKRPRSRLVALVVSVPAITDAKGGTVLAISPLQNWRNVPLRSMLAKLFTCLILIENDTNLAAMGERYRGAARGEEDFVYVAIGAGVGERHRCSHEAESERGAKPCRQRRCPGERTDLCPRRAACRCHREYLADPQSGARSIGRRNRKSSCFSAIGAIAPGR
jgi:glucokinase